LTPQQQADKINAFIANWDELVSDAFMVATDGLYTNIKNRIFNEHLDANEQKIGTYSTKPMLVGAKSFTNKGKADAFFKAVKAKKEEPSKWRTVKNGKHAYILDGGYKELRQVTGLKEINEVNFQFTGSFQLRGMETAVSGDNYLIRFTDRLAQDKGRGYEKKHAKKIFYASKDESKQTATFIGKTLFKEIKKAFGNV